MFHPNEFESLRVPVFGTTLQNVPHDIGEQDLTRKLKEDFPEFFDNVDMLCNKYTTQGSDSKDGVKRTQAVISGARGELRDLLRRSFSKSLYFNCVPFTYTFLPDFGQQRDSNGKRLNPINGTAFHTIREREGPRRRQGIRLFSPEFRALLPEALLNPTGPSALFVQHRSLKSTDLPGSKYFHVQGGNKVCRRIDSVSQLETIQLIRLLNGSTIKGEPVRFQNYDGKIRSNMQDRIGLGIGGALLEFGDKTHSMDLSLLDPMIKNDRFLRSFSLTCSRCEERYLLRATSVNLDYLLASCGCTGHCLSYDKWTRGFVPFDAPYHHPGEQLTRLSYQLRGLPDENLVAIPYLYKMSSTYATPHLMSNVLLPILEEEWRANQENSHMNHCVAVVREIEFLEELDAENNRTIIHLEVQPTKFWKLHRSCGFKEVTITCTVKMMGKHELFQTKTGGELMNSKNLESGDLHLLYEVSWNNNHEIAGNIITLTPHADTKEYSFCRKYLTKLPINFNEDGSRILSGLFISNYGQYLLQKKRSPSVMFPPKINEIISSLNPEQATAFTQSMSRGTSIIHGPPGTGKSYLISAIALSLAKTNPGMVLCTAGSNVACNVMYYQIQKLAQRYHIPIEVCRVFSRGRELLLRKNEMDHENSLADSKLNAPMNALHNLVAADPDYLQGKESLREISKLIETGNEYKMSKVQRITYLKHVAEIEKKIVRKQEIVIMTLGCLAGYRLGKEEHMSNQEDHDEFSPALSISSALVDEAGILTMTSVLPIETLKVDRVLLIGDFKQLQPHVQSQSAEDAGLNRSLMELLIQERCELRIPMTMLKEQFRAHPQLRGFTSHVSYNDNLRDAKSLATRLEKIPVSFFSKFPQLKSNRIWVKNHAGKEKKVDTSFSNETEACIVMRTVKEFVQVGHMEQGEIVVLTPYDAQKTIIEQKLKSKGYGKVACKNVDEYQGNESTCVIVSFTRSNTFNKLGFLMIANRVNVCISRARELLVLCMNLDMLKSFQKQNSHLSRMYNYLSSHAIVSDISDA